MKKELMKNLFYKLIAFSVCICIVMPELTGQIEKEKTIEREFNLNENAAVFVNHTKGNIYVKKSTNGKLIAKAKIKIKGKNQEDIQKVLNKIDIKMAEKGSSELKLETFTGIKSWVQVSGASTITFKDGTKVKGVKNLDIDFEIYLPKVRTLFLKNKYNDIYTEDVEGNLDIELYEGKLYTGNVNGNLDLNLKYGKAMLENAREVNMQLYESDLKMKKVNGLKLNSKYSKHTIEKVDGADIQSYESDFTIGEMNGKLVLNDKYGEWLIQNLEEGIATLYETKMTIEKTEKLLLNSKYADFKLGTINWLDFTASYEDEVTVSTLGALKSSNGKYGNFDVETLTKGIYLNDYETDIDVGSVSATFEGMELNGKYLNIDFPIATNVKYVLDVDVSHGEVDYNEDNFVSVYYKEVSSKLQVRGKANGANDSSPKILVRGYEVNLDLN